MRVPGAEVSVPDLPEHALRQISTNDAVRIGVLLRSRDSHRKGATSALHPLQYRRFAKHVTQSSSIAQMAELVDALP